ncbi:hypothetical protein PCL_00706 [Purpureocillium lilacinum]|uniref:Uncharacterized protein n=1 Tax=Purpureocillium lilacinum TaxID=33203 RepID=A0A2U3E5P0_PURLI|nr:hypothetical protein PCL_00706 [Purpureocillium lilacinum]
MTAFCRLPPVLEHVHARLTATVSCCCINTRRHDRAIRRAKHSSGLADPREYESRLLSLPPLLPLPPAMPAPWAIILVAPLVAAGDDLSDFSNNLAQDLGPLLALFGESITRQYLSESTTFLDYLIFALCPIGIITAIVSAIRVCGHPSLRAFIGRSQEGSGVVEAELCTSTSRDVCELFNQGGITRVLGRPNVLELVCVQDKSADPDPDPDPDPDRVTAPTAARHRAPMTAAGDQKVQLFQDYLEKMPDDHDEWKKQKGSFATSSETDSGSGFAPKPNLSLNVGIKRQPLWVFSLVALIGLVFQAGLVVLAGFGAWKWDWGISQSFDSSSKDYAPRMFISGTALLCLGMFGCAAIVGQATSEVTYKRQKSSASSSRLIWLQPGPQFVGDQSFDPFVHLEDRSKPLESWISSRKEPTGKKFQIATFAATMITLGGYVLQFIGLRGMKAWVSIAQLGITLIMAFLRCLLRMQRLGPKDSEFATMPDLVSGYELDWLAFRLALPGSPPRTKTFMENLRSSFSTGLGRPPSNSPSTDRQLGDMHGSYRAPSWHITGCAMLATRGPDDPELPSMNDAQRKPHGADDVLERDGSSSDTSNQPRNQVHMTTQEMYEQLLSIRKTLANLTGNLSFEGLHKSQYQYWADEQVRVRSRAKQLAAAVGQAADSIIRLEHEGHKRAEITLRISASRPYGKLANEQFREQSLRVMIRPPSTETHSGWAIDPAQAEAILGLWMWSLTYDKRLRNKDGIHNLRQVLDQRDDEGLQIISAGLDNEEWEKTHNIQQEMELWLGTSTTMIPKYTLLVDQDDTLGHGDLWVLKKGHSDVWEKYNGKEAVKDRPPHRFFGWSIVYNTLGLRPCEALSCAKSLRRSSTQDHSQIHIRIQCAPRRHNLLNQCSRELYISLIGSLAPLGGIDTSTVREHEGSIQLDNRDVSMIVDAFVQNGLGSRTDALMSIIPRFRNRIRPQLREMMASILAGADMYRQAGEWNRSQLLLRWACREYLKPQDHDSDSAAEDDLSAFSCVLQKTGELYRWSLARTASLQRREFGLSGIRWMYETYGRRPVSRATASVHLQGGDGSFEIVDRYNAVGTAFEATPAPSSTPPGTIHPLLQAIKDSDRARALYHLCFTNEGEFGSKSLRPALPLAVRSNWTEVVDAILELKGNIDSQDEGGRTALSHCAEMGYEETLTRFLKLGAFADLADGRGRTPLHWAALSGQAGIVRLLLQTGQVDWTRDDADGQTALWCALGNDRMDIVQELLDAGVSLGQPNKNKESPLVWAAAEGKMETMRSLIMAGADVCEADAKQQTPLFCAAMKGRTDAIRLLLEYKADVDQVCSIGRTPLSKAAEMGYVDVVRELIKAGADIQHTGGGGWCPLCHAAMLGRASVMSVLISSGAEVDRACDRARTPLSWVVETGNTAAVQLLIGEGADVSRVDHLGRSCLYFAAEKGHEDIVRILLDCGAEVNRVTDFGRTALLSAAESGHEATVRLLINRGADVDHQTPNYRRTPLSRATERGFFGAVKALLSGGATVDLADSYGKTPLLYAADRGDEDIVKILVESGANVGHKDDFGHTAVSRTHSQAIVQFLYARGALPIAP